MSKDHNLRKGSPQLNFNSCFSEGQVHFDIEEENALLCHDSEGVIEDDVLAEYIEETNKTSNRETRGYK
jgi:hypothetical protein